MDIRDLNSAAEPDLGYGQLFAILLRRRFVFLSVFCAVVSFAVTATMIMKPTYESQMQLLVEPNYPEKEALGVEKPQTQFSKSQLEIDYGTQLTLMQSSEFMEKAVEILRPEYPTLEVEDIEENLEIALVEADKNLTKIVKTVYNDKDPIKTQKVLQTLQKLYQDYNLEQDKLRYTRGLVLINRELPVARQRLLQAERAIEQFRRNHNLIDPEQQAQAVTEALNAIERDRQEIRAQYREIEANYNILQQQIALDSREALLASRLSESSRYQNLLDAIQQTELELAQRRLTYRSADPTIQMLLEQRTSQLELLQQEVQRVLGKSSQLNLTGESLLQEGQLGSTELELTLQLLETRVELLGVEARQQSIAVAERELRAQLARFPSLIAEYNSLQPEVEIQMETIKQLLEKQQELSLELARGGFNWQVVEAPQLGKKTGPSIKRNILLGTVVGLFLGGVAAFLGEAVDDTIHTGGDLQRLATIPVLGVIPEFPQQRSGPSIMNLPLSKAKVMELAMMEKMKWLPLQDAIDWVYNNIQNNDYPWSSLAVTSAMAGEGKSTVLLGLGMSAARLHQKVLLVDANLRSPALHKYLNLQNEKGLSTFLSGAEKLPNVYNISEGGLNIHVLPAGPIPEDPVRLLSSQQMKELMAVFAENYDLVLVDTGPIIGTVDVLKTASLCRGLVMVAGIDKIKKKELTEALGRLGNIRAIGIIANGERKA